MSNQQLINKFMELHQQYMDLVNKFPVEDREKVLFDKWSLKDVLAHVIGWNDLNTEHVIDVAQGTEPEWVADVDKYNDQQVNKRKSFSWEKVYDEFVQSGERLADTFQELPGEIWDKKCGYEKRYTPRAYLEHMIEHYEKEHIPQLEGYLIFCT